MGGAEGGGKEDTDFFHIKSVDKTPYKFSIYTFCCMVPVERIRCLTSNTSCQDPSLLSLMMDYVLINYVFYMYVHLLSGLIWKRQVGSLFYGHNRLTTNH